MVQERFPGPFATPHPKDAITSLHFRPMTFTVGRAPLCQTPPFPLRGLPSSLAKTSLGSPWGRGPSSGQFHLGLSRWHTGQRPTPAVVRDPAETDRWPLAGRARGGWHLRPAPVQAPPFSAGAALDPELKFISPRKARGQRCGDDSEKPYLLFFTRRRLRDVSV